MIRWLSLAVSVFILCGCALLGRQEEESPLPIQVEPTREVPIPTLSVPTAAAQPTQPISPTGEADPTPEEKWTERRSFPQHSAYTSPAVRPSHLDQQTLDQAVLDFYLAWKQKYLRQMCGTGRFILYTRDVTNGGEKTITHSEAHGYGMVLMAIMAGADPDARTSFDGMYLYFRDHPSVTSHDLMAWNQVEGCLDVDPGNTGTATDGDLEIAYALLLADAQWGSQGEIDYRAEGLKVIQALMQHTVNPETSTLMLGDWANPGEPNYYYATRTSDFMPLNLKAFASFSGDPAWTRVLDTTYALFEELQTRYALSTGLLPDFIQQVNNDPRPAEADFMESELDGGYYYNACRDPWRLGLDYMLTGDERAARLLKRLNTWIYQSTEGDPAQIKSGYRLDGSYTDNQDYLDLSFVAPLGVGAMAGFSNPGADGQVWVNDLWDLLVSTPIEQGGYYDDVLKMMALLAMSGNIWTP